MDQHVRRGLLDTDKIPSQILNFNGCYTIPWRCYYAKDLENVMLAGRDISTTKMAFGSTRVMGTCAVGGQAVGTAAAMAVRYGCTPRQIGEHMEELQHRSFCGMIAIFRESVTGIRPIMQSQLR